MKAIVLAGGRGVRLHPYTKVLPKPLIPLQDTPLLQIILQQLRQAGFTDVCLSLYYKADQIERYFGDGQALGLRLSYSRSYEALGTAGPLALVDMFDEPCLVMNADLLTNVDFADVYAAHRQGGAIATMLLCNHGVDMSFGVVKLDPHHQIASYAEKPRLNFLINGGIYVLDPAVLSYLRRGVYMDMSTLIQQLLHDGHSVKGYVFAGDWFDIGTIEQYQLAEQMFGAHPQRYLRRPCPPADAADAPLLAELPQLMYTGDELTLLWR